MKAVIDKQRLDEVSKGFKRLQRQKSRKMGGVEARVIKARTMRWGEQHVNQDSRGLATDKPEENKLSLVFNILDKAANKLAGRLTALGGNYYTRPDKQDPKAQADAEVCDKLLQALDEKLDQPTKTWELVDTLLTDGVAFIYTPWIPNSTQEPVPQFQGEELLFKNEQDGSIVPQSIRDQAIASGMPEELFTINEELELTGDVGCEILSALNVFVDQSVKSIADLATDQHVDIAKIRTKGWIEDNYGPLGDVDLDSELKIISTSFFQDGDPTASLYLKDLLPMYQGEVGEDDPDMAVVVERYEPVSPTNTSGRLTCFIPNKKILFDGPCPYKEIPILDVHFGPVTGTFWTKDFVTDLIAPQKFLNKRLSQLGEQANSSLYSNLLLGGTLAAKDISVDKPGIIEGAVSETGIPMVQRLEGATLPTYFLESINLVGKLFTQIAGGSDLFEESQFPGQMRGPMAVPLLQELLDSQWGPLYRHIGVRFAQMHQQRLNRVGQFYPPLRTLHYTSHDQRDEVLEFHSDILKGGTKFNVTVERDSLVPEFKALREQRLIERLNGPLGVLYIDDRTGHLDKSKVAAELKMGDFGREGKEDQARTFQRQLIDRLWKAQQCPPVLQFWDHEPMLDELESTMMTTEWLSASPPVQQLFMDRWNQHSFFLQQRAQMQQQAQMAGAVQNAVAQATQQAAAMAASQTVHSAQSQIQAQQQTNHATQQGGQGSMVEQLIRQNQGGTKGLGQSSPQPAQGQPQPPPNLNKPR